MIVLALVTLALAAVIWWKLLQVETSYPVALATEFQAMVAQIKVSIQKLGETVGRELLPTFKAAIAGAEKLGEVLQEAMRRG